MNTNSDSDFDGIAQTWLQEGPTAIPDRSLQAALEEVHATRQRRFGAAWRTFHVNTNSLRMATAVVVSVLIVGAAVFYLGNFAPSGTVGGTPSVPPTPTATPVLTMTKTFTSVNNGFAVGYPADWTVQPATLLWWPPDRVQRENYGLDVISGPCKSPCQRPYTFSAGSAVAPEGVVIDDWIDRHITIAGDDICNPPRTTLPEITIDGHAGRVNTTCPRDVEATVVVGRRVYLFTLATDYERPERQAMFDAFVATIDLRPEGAPAAPTPTPSAP